MLVPFGEGGPAAERGDFTVGGRIPINPSGGLESKGHPIGATGLGQIHELVTQLRGEAGKRQASRRTHRHPGKRRRPLRHRRSRGGRHHPGQTVNRTNRGEQGGYVFRTEEQQAAVDGLKGFLDDRIDPVFSKEYRDKFVPREKMAEIMRELTQFGLVSGVVSEKHGGMGVHWLTMIMLFEEVATTACDLSVPVLINSFGAHMLEKLAPDHLRERYLPGMISGELFCSIGISEPSNT